MRVLDALEALRDRAQPAGDALDVGRRGDAERAHRGLLGLDGLLAGLERARHRCVHDRVGDQLLDDLAEGLLALPGERSRSPRRRFLGHRRQRTASQAKAAGSVMRQL